MNYFAGKSCGFCFQLHSLSLRLSPWELSWSLNCHMLNWLSLPVLCFILYYVNKRVAWLYTNQECTVAFLWCNAVFIKQHFFHNTVFPEEVKVNPSAYKQLLFCTGSKALFRLFPVKVLCVCMHPHRTIRADTPAVCAYLKKLMHLADNQKPIFFPVPYSVCMDAKTSIMCMVDTVVKQD